MTASTLNSPTSWFRKLLLSEYFVLYLTIIYVLVLWPFIPPVMSARNNAILSAIKKAADDAYDGNAPQVLRGIFFPQSLAVNKKKDRLVAEVSGETIFN